MSQVDETSRLLADGGTSEPLRAILRSAADDGPTSAELAGLTSRLQPLIGAPMSTAPASAIKAAGWATRARGLLIGVGLIGGGVTGYFLFRSDPPREDASRSAPVTIEAPPQPVIAPPTPTVTNPVEPEATATPIEPKPEPAALHSRGGSPIVKSPPPPAEPSPPSEVTLLEQARKALRDGDLEGALASSSQHQKQYPDGVLGEEREALAIEALVKLDRIDEARARWSTFAGTYPRSNYRARLQRLFDVRDRR